MLSIVLVDPQIPANTGNIGRLCVCTGSRLFLVGTPGFFITDKHLKRAGMDYWNELLFEQFDSLETLQNQYHQSNFLYASTKAKQLYTDITYTPNDFIVFGSETKGLPEKIIVDNPDKCIRIPMISDKRSLNLATSTGIILYEAIRQTKPFHDRL
jgi:tRNA (cytidine/uridine-2'-O-)-methyltransferase